MVNRSTSLVTHTTTTNIVQSAALSSAKQQLKKYDGQFVQLESWLAKHPTLDNFTELVASKSGLRRAHVALAGTLLLLVTFIFGPIAKLFGSLVGVSYPAYKSIKAIENPVHEDDRKWLTYWVVFAFFSVARNFSGFILSWFPFYNILELGILLWMMAPIKHNGSHFLYNTVLRPFVLKHIDTIDSTLDSVQKSFTQQLGTDDGGVDTSVTAAPAVLKVTPAQAKGDGGASSMRTVHEEQQEIINDGGIDGSPQSVEVVATTTEETKTTELHQE